MSSVLRRRSRDPGISADEADLATSSPKSRPTKRKAILTAALLSILLLTLFIIFQLDLGISADQWTFNFSSKGPKAEQLENRFELHPQHHVLRNATTLVHHWRVSSGERRPDGVLKKVYLVNGVFPGPTIEGRSGDRVIVHVKNALEDDEGVSIHWHGLSMRGANEMDGATGVTQAPIAAGKSFVYEFTIDGDQHGTFWWHAHDGVQRADGLYGGLVIHKPQPDLQLEDLDDERLLLIGDWYHRPAAEALQSYSHPGAFGLETIPDSVIVNGLGNFRCSDAVPARPVDCIQVNQASLKTLSLDARRRNVFRVVNVGAYAGCTLNIDGSLMTPLEVDGGHSINGVPSKSIGAMHPGERVNLLVELSPIVAHFQTSLKVTIDDAPFKYQNLALTATHRFPLEWHGAHNRRDVAARATYEHFDIQNIQSAVSQAQTLPQSADYTFVLYALTQKLARLENQPFGFINHTRWEPSSPPLLELSRNQWNKHQLVPYIQYKAESPVWIDVVLNNLDEDAHPFHLHGDDFWILAKYSSGTNWGSYNPFEDKMPPGGKYNLRTPVKRDTFYVPRRGYAVLRFRADNPGLWMFHCHVLWHQATGMSMAFEVR